MSVEFKLSGVPEIMKALERDFESTSQALKAVVLNMAEDIAKQSDQLVPVDEGTLRSSRTIDRTNLGDRYQVTVGYGGPAAPYAIVQHERLDFWHPPKPPGKNSAGISGKGPVKPGRGRGPKYLEIPFLNLRKKFPAALVGYVRRAKAQNRKA